MAHAPEIDGPEVRDALRRGRIVAHPAESMYGLGVAAADAEAVGRLRALKGSTSGRGFIVLVDDLRRVRSLARWTEAGRAVASAWPAPLTIVLPARPGVPAAAADGTVAVRLSADEGLRRLAAAAGGAVISTSANRAGGAPARTAAEVRLLFGEEIGLIIDGGRRDGPPSTVVDATGVRPRLVRAGAFAWEEAVAA